MEPSSFSCALCGWSVGDGSYPESWANQFRGLYSGPKHEGIVLTGVGLHNNWDGRLFIAPPNRNGRWTDAGYKNQEEDTFGVAGQIDFNCRHGFIFHEACWDLLQEASRPAPVPLQRLHDICRSLPIPLFSNFLCWGHDYGGVTITDSANYFPWEYGHELRSFPKPDPVFSANPYQAFGVDRILAEVSELEVPSLPRGPPSTQTALLTAALPGNDCFISLPQELCAAIAMYLPTKDLLSARLASRAFWPVFHSQQFWASRFKGSSERAWFFEARRRPSKGPRDWRSLYRRTSNANIGCGLRNRKRIWGLAKGVVRILALAWDGPRPGSSLSLPQHRVEATGDLLERDTWSSVAQRFYNGCRTSRRQSIAVPDRLARLSVSTVADGDQLYIAGISLTSATGDTIRLGYHDPSGFSEQSLELSELWGLRLAVGSAGIQALQCIAGPSNSTTSWLGCPDDSPRTERLAVVNRIVALEAGFDAYKMVSLAIYCNIPRPLLQPFPRGSGLRNSGVWYPDVPGPNLCLHEDSFPPASTCAAGYKPLFWTHFGGPGGKYLQHLRRIRATCSNGLRRIDFVFDIPVPAAHRTFGRYDKAFGGRTTCDFAIDGPGGERIESIEIGHRYLKLGKPFPWKAEEGIMGWCKLYTNRGRSCLIYEHSPREAQDVNTTITVAPGTAITGLYAARPQDGSGIAAMGVTSEEVGGAGRDEEAAMAL